MRFAARLLLLALSLGSVWINGLFAFTNQAWVMMGSRQEFYPEWAYLFVGFPLAVTALVGASAWIAASIIGPPNPRLLWPILGFAWAGLAFSVVTAVIPFTGAPLNLGLPQWLSEVLFLGSPFLMFGQIVLGGALVINASHR